MTLKEHLELNSIDATPDDRSRIGRLISKPNDCNGYVFEDGQRVKDYKKNHLNSEETKLIIIVYFTHGRG